VKGKVTGSDDSRPKLMITTNGEDQRIERLTPDATITINGKPASLNDLKKGDSVKVTTLDGDPTVAVTIEATRFDSGRLVSAGDGKIVTTDGIHEQEHILSPGAKVTLNEQKASLDELKAGDLVKAVETDNGAVRIEATRVILVQEFWQNFRKNLFKPLLLFFYMGFSVPFLKIAFEFPHVIYQGLTIYLLVAIGWHGGEELSHLSGSEFMEALGFMGIGFVTNFCLGIIAYFVLRTFIPRMRKVDAATVSAYYGSDSAGTFVTCVGVLTGAGILYAPFMPVLLAVMEIPGCLVGLFLVSQLRKKGMDALGNMPDEPGYNPKAKALAHEIDVAHGHSPQQKAEELETRMALENKEDAEEAPAHTSKGGLNAELLREVFLNPGLFLLFGGILIGFISGMQGHKVTAKDDKLFLDLFEGLLCLFLLEMGMTAARRLQDLKAAGWRFIVFGVVTPNIFASIGICVAHMYSMFLGEPFALGTYALFAVLCGAASYIAVPAIQRLAIPEASPTLPLAASLGLTFSYNVTIGIPVYIMIATIVTQTFPVVARSAGM
jgi:hypothetical protein